MGALTPLGLTARESWQAVKDGVCGIAPITQFDASAQKVKLAAEVKGFVPENYLGKPEAKRMGRFTQMAVVAARRPWPTQPLPWRKRRRTVAVSSSPAALEDSPSRRPNMTVGRNGLGPGIPVLHSTGICNMAAGMVAIDTGFRGMCSCPVTACAGGTNAVGDAFHYIRDGYAEVMLCGGTESSLTPLAVGGLPP